MERSTDSDSIGSAVLRTIHGGGSFHVCLGCAEMASFRSRHAARTLFLIRHTHARGGSRKLVSKWLDASERISKYGSTAFTISLALRCGGPGPRRISSAFPSRLNHRPASSK